MTVFAVTCWGGTDVRTSRNGARAALFLRGKVYVRFRANKHAHLTHCRAGSNARTAASPPAALTFALPLPLPGHTYAQYWRAYATHLRYYVSPTSSTSLCLNSPNIYFRLLFWIALSGGRTNLNIGRRAARGLLVGRT